MQVAISLLGCNLLTNVAQNTPRITPKAGERIQEPAKTSAPKQGRITPVNSPVLPAPPGRMEVSLQDPEQAGSQLGQALASQDKLSAWLGLYHALGIPVIGEDRRALDGSDDPVGPPYWQVWYAASLDLPGHGIPLADAGRLLGWAFGFNAQDSQTAGELLLNDLRAATQSQDAAVRLLGEVARRRIRQSGSHLDILDSATTAQTASIDGATLQLISWVALRAALFKHAAQVGVEPGMISRIAYSRNTSLLQAAPFNCSEAWGDADSTYWANWIINKSLGGGVQLPGMKDALPGILEMMLKQMEVAKDTIQAAGKAIGWANAVGGAISLIMQLSAMEVVGIQNPDKLERTKFTSNGKTSTIIWRLSSDPGKLPNGNEIQQCFVSYLTNILGVGFTFPSEGRIAGAELRFKDGKNIPERVLFGNYDQVRTHTNSNGEAQLDMIGVGQEKNLPDSSRPVDLEYSILVSAQPEESGLNSMVNLFFDGLSMGVAPNPAGFISSLIDMLKTFTFDLGEQVFPMIDWNQKVYRASGGTKIAVVGNICDMESSFQLTGLGNNGVTYFYNFTPNSGTSGAFAYEGSSQGCTESGSGMYTIQFNDDASQGTVEINVSGSIVCEGVSSNFSGKESFDLTADPAATCP